eukprot:gene5699-9519_t
MNQLAEDNSIPKDEIKSFTSNVMLRSEIITKGAQNKTRTVVLFEKIENENKFKYEILWNGTTSLSLYEGALSEPYIVKELQKSIDNAILHVYGSKQDKIEVEMKPYPNPPMKLLSIDFNSLKYGDMMFFGIGSTTISLTLILFWIIILYLIVYEKENNLRTNLSMTGVKNSSYWFSWLISCFLFLTISVLSIIATGMIFRVSFFIQCDFSVTFLILFCYGMSLISIGMLISSITSTVKSAMITVFILNALSIILNTLVTNPLFVILIPFQYPLLGFVFTIYPPFNFARIFSLIGYEIYIKKLIFSGSTQFGTYGFKDLFTKGLLNSSAGYLSLVNLCWNSMILLLLAWYFDYVFSDNHGVRKPFHFCFLPSFWGFSKKVNIREYLNDQPVSTFQNDEENSMDENVLQEIKNARNFDENLFKEDEIIRIVEINKVYSNSSQYVNAVKNVSFISKKGTCFSLLGHNGAGKTTLISMLTGLISISGGDAFILGYNVKTEINKIRQFIGICPQHDIFWPNLSAYEHLSLYASIKGIPFQDINREVSKLLKSVKLQKVGSNLVETFSGGMKRRLSVAMSLIGNPMIVFLDEPTTGLDPKSKRDVWELINELKKDKLVFLTTHSMEEADALADQIAIMSNGKIKCLGDSLYLKSKYGGGYSLTINLYEVEKIDQIVKLVQEIHPDSNVISKNSGNILFKLTSTSGDFPELLSEIEKKEEEKIIKNWGISQTSLEEVYLAVTKSNH